MREKDSTETSRKIDWKAVYWACFAVVASCGVLYVGWPRSPKMDEPAKTVDTTSNSPHLKDSQPNSVAQQTPPSAGVGSTKDEEKENIRSPEERLPKEITKESSGKRTKEEEKAKPAPRRDLFSFEPLRNEEQKKKAEGATACLTSDGKGGTTIYLTGFTLKADNIEVPSSGWVVIRSSVVGSSETLEVSINSTVVWEHEIKEYKVVESPPVSLSKCGVKGNSFSASVHLKGFPPTGGIQWLSICEATQPARTEEHPEKNREKIGGK